MLGLRNFNEREGIMYGIVARVKHDRILREDATVRILALDGDPGYPLVAGPSKHGGTIAKITRLKRLQNFRAVWVHPEVRHKWLQLFETEEQALGIVVRLVRAHHGWMGSIAQAPWQGAGRCRAAVRA
jgi:hypothetical protein